MDSTTDDDFAIIFTGNDRDDSMGTLTIHYDGFELPVWLDRSETSQFVSTVLDVIAGNDRALLFQVLRNLDPDDEAIAEGAEILAGDVLSEDEARETLETIAARTSPA